MLSPYSKFFSINLFGMYSIHTDTRVYWMYMYIINIHTYTNTCNQNIYMNECTYMYVYIIVISVEIGNSICYKDSYL